MKIVYTDIYNDLTQELINIAKKSMQEGRKVFYIVPSSLSFDKEKEILERFDEGKDTSLFDLTVSRFKQLPWYFAKSQKNTDKVELTDIGQAMLFKRVIREFDKKELPLFHAMSNSPKFLDSLVNLKNELEKSNLNTEDLLESSSNQRIQELVKIINLFDDKIDSEYANYSKIDAFIDDIVNDKFTASLQNIDIIIDGYSRFSAEEENLITALNDKVQSIVIGTYASKEAYSSSYLKGSVYENSVELIRNFENKYNTKGYYFVNDDVNICFTQISKAWENENDATSTVNMVLNLSEDEKNHMEVWKVVNQKEEIEYVAKNIRKLLSEGVRYKDILVLVGDTENYQIKLEQIFNLYEIPYFYGVEEHMRNHPLITVIESLIRVKKYNYESYDLLNLLKSGIYKPVDYSLDDLYDLELYLMAHKIRGKKKFSSPFELAEEKVEELRESLLGEESPIQELLTNNNARLPKTLVNDFKKFLEASNIDKSMESLFNEAESISDFAQANKHQQVWDLLLDTLYEYLNVFLKEKMTFMEFLELVYAGLSNASYRGIPANVDVVNVEDYTLVEPRKAPYVFAIGLSQSNFPKIKANTSLLSDDDREKINESIKDDEDISKYIEQVSVTNNSKNIYNALSLFNAATEHLVLSSPQLYDNNQSEMSPYISFLIDKGVNVVVKKSVNLDSGIEQIGNYRGLLSNLGKLERLMEEDKNSQADNRAFWRTLFRIIESIDEFKKVLLADKDDIKPTDLSKEVLEELYKDNIYASVSSFETFYNCEYQYYLKNTLRIQELETLTLDSRISGNYFHEVFEAVMKKKPSVDSFDADLKSSLEEVYALGNYKYYFQDQTGIYTYSNLLDIIYQTAPMLKNVISAQNIEAEKFEETFGFPQSGLEDYSVDIDQNHQLKLRGKIDRIDRIDQSIGVVDYKSGNVKFDLNKAYYGQSLQFMTYLDILKKNYQANIWGATYLHLNNSPVKLNDLQILDDLPNILLKNMKYDGLFNSEESYQLRDSNLYNISKASLYSQDEINSLINHNEDLYKKAAGKLLDGRLAVNPVVDKNVAVGCRFCKLKAICQFEPDVHMKDGREVFKKSRSAIFEDINDEDSEENLDD